MQSKAKTVAEYLTEMPEDRRKSISKVREVILKNLPAGYEETMLYGMIGYVIPLTVYPKGYLGQKDVPITYAGLANQKNYMSIYLMNVYGDKEIERWFKRAYTADGTKLNMGKSCIRFKSVDQVNLKVIGQAIAKTPLKKYIAAYEKAKPI